MKVKLKITFQYQTLGRHLRNVKVGNKSWKAGQARYK